MTPICEAAPWLQPKIPCLQDAYVAWRARGGRQRRQRRAAGAAHAAADERHAACAAHAADGVTPRQPRAHHLRADPHLIPAPATAARTLHKPHSNFASHHAGTHPLNHNLFPYAMPTTPYVLSKNTSSTNTAFTQAHM